ncbi:MAG: NFACT family protein [Clostridia bacterium]|nr:NFACT family protein [Clostridia bacterium]
MAFDGVFLHKIVNELNNAVDCHIDKIYQPSKDELVFLLRKKGFVKRLLITAKSGSARLHFTENKYENPTTPPNFCMLLRKYLSAARLTGVSQPDFERVAELSFSATNEMGDIVPLNLVCELIGNQANIILVRDGKIVDALKHSDVETAKRLILPGAEYEYPPSQQKQNPLSCNSDEICKEAANSKTDISRALMDLLAGFSPLVCREIEYKYALLAEKMPVAEALKVCLETVICDITDNTKPIIIFKPDGTPFEFSYTDISQYGADFNRKVFGSFSELLDAFYTAKDTALRIQAAAHDIIKLVNNLYARTQKKLSIRLEELKKCQNRDTLRIYGELIKANLYAIKNGSSFAEVQNFYDENLELIRIPLNPALTPAKNAERYFKEYKKTYTAEQTLTELTKNDRQELLYFETVLDSINRCKTLAEIAEIREELAQAGYIKKSATPKKKNPQSHSFKEYTSVEGYRILVGKNNTQNDYITTKLASKNDLWFHVKNIPGSHVVVFSGGEEVSDGTVEFAAVLAAQNSKAASSAQVPVDYTPVKYVKKPSGAKPGMVIYTTNKTVYVDPKENVL